MQHTSRFGNSFSDPVESEDTKTINLHTPNKISWAAWVIARLGGWKGCQHERPPGHITFL